MANTNFATALQLTEIEDTIKDILNAGASGVFGGAVSDKRRSAAAITSARRKAVFEIIEAIASNPSHGFWQSLATDVAVESGAILPAFLGTPGIPQIQPFDGAEFGDGIEERPEMIDYYRSPMADNFQQTLNNAPATAHNLAYNGLPSRGSGKYSIRGQRVKFTGFACKVPLIISPQVSDNSNFNDYCDKHLPAFSVPCVIGLSFQYLVKEGDNILPIAQGLVQFGKAELNKIRGGAMAVEALPKISDRQRIIR